MAHWSPDASKIVIQVCILQNTGFSLPIEFMCPLQTLESHLVIVSVEYKPNEVVYQSPPLSPTAQRNFLPGPGEGLPLQSITLHFDGVIRVEGSLLRWDMHYRAVDLSDRQIHTAYHLARITSFSQ